MISELEDLLLAHREISAEENKTDIPVQRLFERANLWGDIDFIFELRELGLFCYSSPLRGETLVSPGEEY